MTYDEIFNRFYNLMDDPNFYKLPQDFAYDRMRSWLHDAASKPYMVIGWLKPQVDNAINTARIIGSKEEKNIQSNYKTNIERLESLERNLRKFIRDDGYINNSYISGGETS